MKKELSHNTKKLIERFKQWHSSQQPEEGVATVHVDEIASRVASVYEKLRGIIDWREEHLLRKTAIERMMRRNLFLKKEGKEIALPLIKELIRAGHFPNDQIEEKNIERVQNLINKYLFILQNAPSNQNEQKVQLYNWLIKIAACELEDALSPRLREKGLIEFMYKEMREKIIVKEREKAVGFQEITEEEKNTQIFIAVQQSLFKLDESLITYHLLKRKFPNWQNLSFQELRQVTENIYSIWNQFKNSLSHPISGKFYKICEKYDTPYLLLGDILSKEPEKVEGRIYSPKSLEKLTEETYNNRLTTLKSRLGRAAFYSTLSIFLSNILLLLAVEIPLAKFITGQFNFTSIAVDVLGPTFLMGFLVITIRPPQKGNLKAVIMEMMKITYKTERKDTYQVRTFPKRSGIINKTINLFYFGSFCITFGLLIWFLYKINFPLLSYPIFIMFISLIAFAGTKIRERAKDLQLIERKGSVPGFFVDLLSLPILRLGKWLSGKWKKYNVLAVLFSALIDMPFMMFVRFLEQWRYFLKEKREQIH